MSDKYRKYAFGRITFGFFSILLSGGATYFFGGLLDKTGDAVAIIATIFSILAGVLIAVISILGDPSMILDQSWRHATISSEENQRKLHRKNDIFVLYILLLGSLFIFTVTPKEWVNVYCVVQHSVFFLTVFAFLVSLSLPYSLKAIQRERLLKSIGDLKKRGSK